MSVILITGASTGIRNLTARALARAGDAAVASAYAELDPLVAGNEEATRRVFPPGVVATTDRVADEITRILGVPRGQKPFCSVVDVADAGVDHVMRHVDNARENFVLRMGLGDLLRPSPSWTVSGCRSSDAARGPKPDQSRTDRAVRARGTRGARAGRRHG
jgi:NAD(P)-dependent dehydrogenase (short-subunit alcohol dehydrogenase family)